MLALEVYMSNIEWIVKANKRRPCVIMDWKDGASALDVYLKCSALSQADLVGRDK